MFIFFKEATISDFYTELDLYVDTFLTLLEQLNLFLSNQFQEFQCWCIRK